MENLQNLFQQADDLLKKKKTSASLRFPSDLKDKMAGAADKSSKLRLITGTLRSLPASFERKYGAVSREAAIVRAMQTRFAGGTGWGVAVTGPTLLPSPLSGDPSADRDTDTSTLFIAVTNGKKAAVQQIACPGDLSDPALLEAMTERAIEQAVLLLIGILSEEPSALSLLTPAARYKKYARSPLVSFAASILPWKGDGIGDALIKTALIAALAVLVVTGGMTVSEQNAIQQNVKDIQKAVEVYTAPPTAEEESGLPEGYLSKFASLYTVNSDVTGWLTIPDTNIDLPIMQAEDNDYYLSHDLYGEKDPYGLPYIDYRVPIKKDYWAKNTIVYGHNMNAGYVFHQLIGYRDADFYKDHPFLTFDTVYNESEWVVFAAFEANTDAGRGEVFEYYNYVTSTSEEKAQWYIDEVTARSYFTNPVDVNTSDTFLTLQTCSNNRTDTKLCIVARKLRKGESEADFDFSSSVNNTSRIKPTFY